jgi:hypothetical protein
MPAYNGTFAAPIGSGDAGVVGIIHELAAQQIQGGLPGEHYHVSRALLEALINLTRYHYILEALTSPSLEFITLMDGEVLYLAHKELTGIFISDPIGPANPIPLPEDPADISIVGKNPYFANMMIVGSTDNKITIAKSIRYYEGGPAPTYNNNNYIVFTKYYESGDNGNTWISLGSNTGQLDATISILPLNALSVNGVYCVIDYQNKKVWRGADGIIAKEVTGAFGTDRPIWFGCSNSRFVVITAPYNTVYTSTDGLIWTNKGAASGLPFEFIYTVYPDGQVAYNTGPSHIRWINNFWFSSLGYITTDPDAKIGWNKPANNLNTLLGADAGTAHIVEIVFNGSRYAAIVNYQTPSGVYSQVVSSVDFITWAIAVNVSLQNIMVLGTEFYGYNTTGNNRWNTTGNGTVWTMTVTTVGISQFDRVSRGNSIFLSKYSGFNQNYPTPSTDSQYAPKRSIDNGQTFQTCIINL